MLLHDHAFLILLHPGGHLRARDMTRRGDIRPSTLAHKIELRSPRPDLLSLLTLTAPRPPALLLSIGDVSSGAALCAGRPPVQRGDSGRGEITGVHRGNGEVAVGAKVAVVDVLETFGRPGRAGESRMLAGARVASYWGDERGRKIRLLW